MTAPFAGDSVMPSRDAALPGRRFRGKSPGSVVVAGTRLVEPDAIEAHQRAFAAFEPQLEFPLMVFRQQYLRDTPVDVLALAQTVQSDGDGSGRSACIRLDEPGPAAPALETWHAQVGGR